MLLYEGILLIGKKSLCQVMMKDIKQPLRMYQLGFKGARKEHRILTHGIQKIRNRRVITHYIRRNRPSVYSVYPVALRGIQCPVFIFQQTDVADLTIDPGLLEPSGKLFKLPQSRVFQKIHYGNVWSVNPFGISLIQGKEGFRPRIKELKGLELKASDDSLMSGIVYQCLSYLIIPDHGSSSVGIDLTELKLTCILMIEQIHAGYGQEAFIGGRQKDKLLKLFGKGEKLPVFPVLTIFIYHLPEDPVSRCYYPLKMLCRLRIEYLRDMNGFIQNSVIEELGVFKGGLHFKRPAAVFLHMAVYMLPVRFVYLFLQPHFIALLSFCGPTCPRTGDKVIVCCYSFSLNRSVSFSVSSGAILQMPSYSITALKALRYSASSFSRPSRARERTFSASSLTGRP